MYLLVLSENLKTSLRSRKRKSSVLTDFVTVSFYFLYFSFGMCSQPQSQRSSRKGVIMRQ